MHGLIVGCLYLPNGNPAPGPKFDYKLRWLARLLTHAATLARVPSPVILAGDYNVIPTERDVYKPERWVDDALFRVEVREAFATLAQARLDGCGPHAASGPDDLHLLGFLPQRVWARCGPAHRSPVAQCGRRRRSDGGRRRARCARLGEAQRPRPHLGGTAVADAMTFDALHLARAQFAFTMSFHFVFPAFSIGLASYLMVLEGLWLNTGKAVYLDLFNYWLKIFAVAFGMGVVSGIVMSYQFGTNWSVYSNKAGPVIGPLMAYEVLTAFFLEAGFLGVMLFGMSKVGKGLHFFATCMVALGTLISATWIISANSWMQTPVGFAMNAKGQFVPAGSWWTIMFNPSFPYRLVHTVIAAYLTTALTVGGVGAWHLLRDRANPHARKMFSMAMWMAALVAPIQILAGDTQGLNTLKYQPIKVLAMEGDFDPSPTRRSLGAFRHAGQSGRIGTRSHRDPEARLVDPGARSEQGASRTQGFPARALAHGRHRVLVVSHHGRARYRHAVARVWSLIARGAARLYDSPLLHRAAVLHGAGRFRRGHRGMGDHGSGRQPYTVYGQLLTADSHLPARRAGGRNLARGFRRGVLHRVRRGRRLSAPDDGPTRRAAQELEPPHIPQRAAGITPRERQSIRPAAAQHSNRER